VKKGITADSNPVIPESKLTDKYMYTMMVQPYMAKFKNQLGGGFLTI